MTVSPGITALLKEPIMSSRRAFLTHFLTTAGVLSAARATAQQHQHPPVSRPEAATPGAVVADRWRRSGSRRNAGRAASPVRDGRRRQGVSPDRRACPHHVSAEPRRGLLGLQRLDARTHHRSQPGRSGPVRCRRTGSPRCSRCTGTGWRCLSRWTACRDSRRTRFHPAGLHLRVHAPSARHVLLPLAHGRCRR